jgi:hypothetical protein
MICPVCGNEVENNYTRCPYCGAIITGVAKQNDFSKMYLFNIEKNMPYCEDAKKIMYQKIFELKKGKTKVIKLIHGYGSSGIGGELRYCLREYLDSLIKRGIIRFWVAGEDFSNAYPTGKKIISTFKWILSDFDYNKKNKGITLIVL